MTISIWRYSHLSLALVSGLFLLLASITGIILAFEPIQHATQSYAPEELSGITLAETLEVLQKEYDEVLTLKVDANDFLVADVITQTGDSKSVYVHPLSGAILGEPQPQHPIFQFTTNLHRSLFLKGIGRFFVGLVSFLLCLIAITGLLLIIRRQGGIAKLFSKIQKDYFELRYHVILGRLFLVPIIIVAATGVYLSAEKFNLLPSTKVTHQMLEPEEDMDMSVRPTELDLFQKITMDEVRSVTFPFSEFPEDYFELALDDRELYVHQYTGAILSEQKYPFTLVLSQLSLTLHTGQGSILWSSILLLASGSILFFIYSGWVMWRKRIKSSKVLRTKTNKEECSHIILVGSETGTTYAFAEALEKGLVKAGKTVLVAQINDYTTYEKAEHLIFLTATYGEGEAPTNARNIKHLLQEVHQPHPLQFSVVGFGSLTYPGYCQFAIDLNEMLALKEDFTPVIPLYKINNQSFDAFKDWTNQWSSAAEVQIQVAPPKKKIKKSQSHSFEVVGRTDLNVDDTYLLHLKPKRKLKFQSGDLWEYTPDKDGIPRSYSIAKYGGGLLLSIKKHEFGVCSTFLSTVANDNILKGGIKRNFDFHFPKSAPAIVCIGNGTGIAPFLGIIDENERTIPIDLYWGGRTQNSVTLYKGYLDRALEGKRLAHLHLALSRENGTKVYVQQLLERDKEKLAKKLEIGAVFMICGSMAMQGAVLEVLEEVSYTLLDKPLSAFEHQEQLKMDCY
ncbi:MAG: PepSY domain-containing protein [Cyanobacteria bacterium P01_A01_bin.68]